MSTDITSQMAPTFTSIQAPPLTHPLPHNLKHARKHAVPSTFSHPPNPKVNCCTWDKQCEFEQGKLLSCSMYRLLQILTSVKFPPTYVLSTLIQNIKIIISRDSWSSKNKKMSTIYSKDLSSCLHRSQIMKMITTPPTKLRPFYVFRLSVVSINVCSWMLSLYLKPELLLRMLS